MQDKPQRRFLALWFPWLAAERLVRREPALGSSLLVLIEELRGRLILCAVSPGAARAGLRPGMVLADARAAAPRLTARFADISADKALLVKLAGWATRYTPWAAPVAAPDTTSVEADSLFLDITGCAHLFGGEQALAEQVLARLKALGLTARLAVADTPGAAWAFAHHGADPLTIAPPFADAEDAMAALAGLPVSALRLDGDTQDALAHFGLASVGALYPLARTSLAERFGAALVTRLDQALGRVDEPISPRRPVPPHAVRRAFVEPIGTLEDIAAATRELIEGLCEALSAAGAGARKVQLCCYRVDGSVQQITIGTSRPARWPGPLNRLFGERLERIDPGFGVEIMVLAATVAEPLTGFQTNWHKSAGEGQEDLSALIDRLGNRIGFSRIARPVPRQSWLPERAVHFGAPFLDKPQTPNWQTLHWQPGRARPLRLLPRPEPVEAIAPVPDDPPVMFRWHKIPHRVRRADGPERLCAEWWLEEGAEGDSVRDYYTVEDTDGRRYWLYREGLYGPDTQPKWFLHGVFG